MAPPSLRRAPGRLAFAAVSALTAVLPIVLVGDDPLTAAATTWNVFGTATPRNPSDPDRVPVELGMGFRSSRDGTAVGVRFYKGSTNTGTHVGNLWSGAGQRLATATFTAETATGWQSVRFASPVAVKANTDYVVSYHTVTGHYASDTGGLSSPVTNGPLTATGSVYRYGSSGFPSSTYEGTNYWVDVLVEVRAGTQAGPGAGTPATTEPAGGRTSSAPGAGDDALEPGEDDGPGELVELDDLDGVDGVDDVDELDMMEAYGVADPPRGWPNDASTGVPRGTRLTRSGSFTVTEPGTVIDALDVDGAIRVMAANVTIKRSRFTGTGQRIGVQVIAPASVRIEDCEFTGTYRNAAVGYENYTLVRSEISGVSSDGLKIGDNTTVQDNWIHSFSTSGNIHADGAQVEHGVENAIIRHNSITMTQGQNSALFISPSLGPDGAGPLTVENNLLGGGNFALYILDGAKGSYVIKNIAVRNNRFLDTSRYGAAKVDLPVAGHANVLAHTGDLVQL